MSESSFYQRRGLMLILSSPSGAGKSSIARGLLADDDDISLSVSTTTRPPRPSEINGRDYHFVDMATFDHMKNTGAFLEWAKVFHNFYGTPRQAVEDHLSAGRDVLFDIDWQGTQQLNEKVPQDVVSVFILPPNGRVLEDRLRRRAEDSEDVIRARMAKAGSEISHWPEYDYVLVNNDLDTSIGEVKAILTAERLKRERLVGLSGFARSIIDELTG